MTGEETTDTHPAGPTVERRDVCIIGAGWSGLLAARHMIEQGLSVVLLERRTGLGGVWRFDPDPDVITVMKSTITSSSATVTEASDFPMDPAAGNFVHHTDVLDYLERYARHFDLTRHIRFGRTVQRARRHGAGWRVTSDGGVVESRFLVVATGTNQRLNATHPALDGFTGPTVHAGRIKGVEPDDYGPGDHVLVYGGGETASDIVEALTQTPARVTWAIPRGQHFFRKARYRPGQAPGVYDRNDTALDEASSRVVQYVSPFARSKPGMKWLCLLGSTGSTLDYEGHGVPEWRKDVPFMRAFVNKNGHVVEHVRSGRVRAAGEVAGSDGAEVRFTDGRRDRFSHVIGCTGYRPAFDFLPRAAATVADERYKLVFDPADPTLAFVGFARPTVGSIPLIAEVQCFMVSRFFAGHFALPDRVTMAREIAADRARMDAYFMGQRRSPGLVPVFDYGYEVAALAGVAPQYRRLAVEDPLTFIKTVFSPATAAQLRLRDPLTRRRAVDQIWSRTRPRHFVYPAIYLLARALRVDGVVERLQAAHLERQRRSQPTPVPAVEPTGAEPDVGLRSA